MERMNPGKAFSTERRSARSDRLVDRVTEPTTSPSPATSAGIAKLWLLCIAAWGHKWTSSMGEHAARRGRLPHARRYAVGAPPGRLERAPGAQRDRPLRRLEDLAAKPGRDPHASARHPDLRAGEARRRQLESSASPGSPGATSTSTPSRTPTPSPPSGSFAAPTTTPSSSGSTARSIPRELVAITQDKRPVVVAAPDVVERARRELYGDNTSGEESP